jgi:hypothetical protein
MLCAQSALTIGAYTALYIAMTHVALASGLNSAGIAYCMRSVIFIVLFKILNLVYSSAVVNVIKIHTFIPCSIVYYILVDLHLGAMFGAGARPFRACHSILL